ncbi:MAG TPA: glycosyltransferase family 4 protein [Woeseiaceae bacterium]|nr:glycosyltransferase family 4 protein [Woeseiaceae bacterium]
MRILMTTDSIGGVWSYSVELCRALAAHGCEVVLACLGGPLHATARAEAESLPNVVLHESDYRLEWMEDPWEDVERGADWIAELAARSGADLVHLNCYGPALRELGVPVLLVAHSCVHTWWRATRGGDPDGRWQRYRECVIHALATADRVVAPTAAHLQATGECYDEVNLNGRATVIRNGIDAARWPGERLPGRFVLGVGRAWDEAKNLGQLALIAPELECPTLLVGEIAPGRGGVRNLVRLGCLPRQDLSQYFRRAAAFVHPARYEPFGLAVLEAAVCGCPLVLGDIAPLRELWDGAAEFVHPDDSDALRLCLEQLLRDPRRRTRLGQSARQRALRYGAATMGAEYAAEYRALLAAANHREQGKENVA